MALGPNGLPLPLTGSLDTGAHVVLISPGTMSRLALDVKKLQKPKFIDITIQGNYVSDGNTQVVLTDLSYLLFQL